MHRQILLAETDGLNSSTLFPQAIQLYSHALGLQNSFVARCGYYGGDHDWSEHRGPITRKCKTCGHRHATSGPMKATCHVESCKCGA